MTTEALKLDAVERAYLADCLAMTGLNTPEELIDMANVGQSLMERIGSLIKEPGHWHNWSPADDPAEIVFDMLNHYEDALRAVAAVEHGWLIEEWNSKTGEFKARWFLLEYDNDWTADSTKALRFAREIDAQVYIDEIGWTEAKPTEHRWG